MYQRQIEFSGPDGLEVRPAAQFVKEAKEFDADITMSVDGMSVNAKSLFKLQTLGVVKGSIVTISADGPQAQQAVDHLVALLEQLQ